MVGVPLAPASRRAERRLSVLQLAEVLGNVSAACRRCGIDRKTFYNWRRRFLVQGLQGLEDHSHAPHHRPLATPRALEMELLELARAHPTWGCHRLARALAASGNRLSPPTVQHLLARHALGQRVARIRWVEAHCSTAGQG
jgi:transposase-like protein